MLSTLALALLLQVPAPQQPLAPGTRYDPEIPTVKQVTGHDVREAITPPADIVRYMEALAKAAPERTRLIRYATSWEGRPLVMLLVGSAEHISHLDAIESGLQRLADPRGLSSAAGDSLVANLPVVTALVHGIHGNEISSSGAAMAEAYHLLAARGDTTVDRILAESLVLIDPCENPDGRARFVFQNSIAEGSAPDAAPWSVEHDEPWPGGRVNHYLFDLNRDMFAQSQPESRGRARVYERFWPQVSADMHEMGGNSTYFFPPTAPPANPWFTTEQLQLMDVFGRANAGAFDRRGFAYFNRDTYDAFYPGYMDMWPMTQGTEAMTFEQASPRSLLFLRNDGTVLTYGDGVLHHFTAAIQTAATAAQNRERLLRNFLDFRSSGVEMGQRGPAEYVLTSQEDPGMAAHLARTLVRNGIEVHRASGPVHVGGRTLPAHGTFIVPMAQPAYRMIRNLLDDSVSMDPDFVARQVERRAQREPDEIYDVTAWSLPLLWGVDVLRSQRTTGAAGDTVAVDEPLSAGRALPTARVGYLIPWGTDGAATVAEALQEGIKVRSAGASFTLGGREFGVGTAIVRNSDNGSNLSEELGAIAARHGAEVVPVDDSYVEDGMSLGSEQVRVLRDPRVLLLYDRPASTNSVGWARWVLEQRYGLHPTVVRTSSLRRVELDDYDVIVFPSGNYGGEVGKSLVDRLKTWLREGGTLVTMAESTRWATRDDVGLLGTTAERKGGRPADAPPSAKETQDQPIDYLDAITPADEAPESVPGAILRTVLDTDHWLSAGTDGELGVLVQGNRVFTPLTLDVGENVGHYADLDDLVMSGIVWNEVRPQLADKAFLMDQRWGRGQVVSFAEDPNYRAYAEGTELLFINAVLLGPGR